MKRLVVSAVLLAACATSSTSPGDTPALVLQLDRLDLVAGDTLRVRLQVTNTTRRPVVYDANACNRHFEVLDARQQVVGPYEQVICAAVLVSRILAPGETASVDGFYTATAADLTAGPLPGPVRYLPAGDYTIRPALILLEPTAGDRLRGPSQRLRIRARGG
jgi:hypothetical protein